MWCAIQLSWFTVKHGNGRHIRMAEKKYLRMNDLGMILRYFLYDLRRMTSALYDLYMTCDLYTTSMTSGDRYRLGGRTLGVPETDEVQVVQVVPGQRAAAEVHSGRERSGLRPGEWSGVSPPGSDLDMFEVTWSALFEFQIWFCSLNWLLCGGDSGL